VLIFLADCHAVSWAGLWSGLVARTPTTACFLTLLPILIIPGIMFTTLFFGAAAADLLNDRLNMLLILSWSATSFAIDIVFTVLAMTRLSHDCREAAVLANGG